MALLEDVLLVGTRGSQPAANAVSAGTLYAVSDEGFLIEQSDASAWSQYGPAGASSVIPSTVQGDILYASAADTLAALVKNASATRYLSNTGASNNPAWAQVVLTNGVSGVLPVANGGTGSASGAGILRSQVILTDAQVKALPTTGITLVSGPGAGFYVNIIQAELLTKFTTAAYTNVNTTYASLSVGINGSSFSLGIVNDSTVAPAVSIATVFFGNTAKRVRLPQYLEAVGLAAGSDELYVLPGTVNGAVGLDITANLDNQGVLLQMDNNGSGNLTAGNAANTLIARVIYTIEAVP